QQLPSISPLYFLFTRQTTCLARAGGQPFFKINRCQRVKGDYLSPRLNSLSTSSSALYHHFIFSLQDKQPVLPSQAGNHSSKLTDAKESEGIIFLPS
ncbi:hypothetical protein, partial [Legionella moravica]|uniref:hypothetical protein n=1 Tax=Legionella moravica TaxID=39962 RepID=UPI001EE6AFD2